jgi:hypothetical protein
MDRTPFEHDGRIYVSINGELYVMGSWGWQRVYHAVCAV